MRVVGYPAQAWERLGRAVYVERVQAGYQTAAEWSAHAKVGSRTLLSLERGEAVSGSTLARIAQALGWDGDRPWQILSEAAAATETAQSSEYGDRDLLRALASRLGEDRPVTAADILATLQTWRTAASSPELAELLDRWVADLAAYLADAHQRR